MILSARDDTIVGRLTLPIPCTSRARSVSHCNRQNPIKGDGCLQTISNYYHSIVDCFSLLFHVSLCSKIGFQYQLWKKRLPLCSYIRDAGTGCTIQAQWCPMKHQTTTLSPPNSPSHCPHGVRWLSRWGLGPFSGRMVYENLPTSDGT